MLTLWFCECFCFSHRCRTEPRPFALLSTEEKTLTDQVKWNSRYVTEIKRQDRKLVRRRVVFPTEQHVFIRGIQLRQSVVSLWSQTLSCLLVSLCYCNRQSVSGKKKVGYSKESINIPQNIFSITKWLLNSLFYSLFSWSCQSYKPNNWICKVFSTALQDLPCTEYWFLYCSRTLTGLSFLFQASSKKNSGTRVNR